MTAEIVALPVTQRALAEDDRPHEPAGLVACCDYLLASHTIGRFRTVAAKEGWTIRENAYDAAIDLSAKLLELAAGMDAAGRRAGLRTPTRPQPKPSRKRRPKPLIFEVPNIGDRPDDPDGAV